MKGTETTKALADNLQELLAADSKDIKAIAEECGVSAGSLSKYQNDNGEAGINQLVKIAKYFKVSTDWLLGLSPAKTPDTSVQGACELTGLSEKSITILEGEIYHRENEAPEEVDDSIIPGALAKFVDAFLSDARFRFAAYEHYTFVNCTVPGIKDDKIEYPYTNDIEEYAKLQSQAHQLVWEVYGNTGYVISGEERIQYDMIRIENYIRDCLASIMRKDEIEKKLMELQPKLVPLDFEVEEGGQDG